MEQNTTIRTTAYLIIASEYFKWEGYGSERKSTGKGYSVYIGSQLIRNYNTEKEQIDTFNILRILDTKELKEIKHWAQYGDKEVVDTLLEKKEKGIK